MHFKFTQRTPIEPSTKWAEQLWIQSGNVGMGQWMPFGEFIDVSFPEPSSLPIEIPISEKWRYVTVEYKPGEKPRMTIGGEWVELEKKIGRDGSIVWAPNQ